MAIKKVRVKLVDNVLELQDKVIPINEGVFPEYNHMLERNLGQVLEVYKDNEDGRYVFYEKGRGRYSIPKGYVEELPETPKLPPNAFKYLKHRLENTNNQIELELKHLNTLKEELKESRERLKRFEEEKDELEFTLGVGKYGESE